jgi:predicted transcriptional regulator
MKRVFRISQTEHAVKEGKEIEKTANRMKKEQKKRKDRVEVCKANPKESKT